MKKLVYINMFFLVVTTLITGCSKNNIIEDNKNSSATAHGIVAMVTEVFNNYCMVKVTENNEDFNTDDIIKVYYDNIYRELDEVSEDAKDVKKKEKADVLSVGDKVSITYTKYQKEKDQRSISTSYVLIVD